MNKKLSIKLLTVFIPVFSVTTNVYANNVNDECLVESDSSVVMVVADDAANSDFIEQVDSLYQITAQKLGLDVETLLEQLANGNSVADLADARGIDLATIVDAVFDDDVKLLEEMLTEGQLTSEELNEIKKELRADIELELHYKTVDPFNWLAKKLNLTQDMVFDQLEKGSTLADLATNAGLSSEQTIADFVQFLDTEYARLVTTGLVTKEEFAAEQELYTKLMPAAFNLHFEALSIFMANGFLGNSLEDMAYADEDSFFEVLEDE